MTHIWTWPSEERNYYSHSWEYYLSSLDELKIDLTLKQTHILYVNMLQEHFAMGVLFIITDEDIDDRLIDLFFGCEWSIDTLIE